MSINELILNQVLNSYETLTASGSIPKIANYKDETIEQFERDAFEVSENSTLEILFNLTLDPEFVRRKMILY